jgi:hypothetical protein
LPLLSKEWPAESVVTCSADPHFSAENLIGTHHRLFVIFHVDTVWWSSWTV